MNQLSQYSFLDTGSIVSEELTIVYMDADMDICLWPCGTWCYREDLEEMLIHKSDNYEVIPFGSPEWDAFDQE